MGGREVHFRPLHKIDAGSLRRAGFNDCGGSTRGSGGACSRVGQNVGGLKGNLVVPWGTKDHNQVSQPEYLLWPVPGSEVQKGVKPHDKEEFSTRQQTVKFLECVHRKRRVGSPKFKVGYGKGRLAPQCNFQHAEPMLGRGRSLPLVRWLTRGDEQDAIQAKCGKGGFRHPDVTDMDGVEYPPEDSYASGKVVAGDVHLELRDNWGREESARGPDVLENPFGHIFECFIYTHTLNRRCFKPGSVHGIEVPVHFLQGGGVWKLPFVVLDGQGKAF